MNRSHHETVPLWIPAIWAATVVVRTIQDYFRSR